MIYPSNGYRSHSSAVPVFRSLVATFCTSIKIKGLKMLILSNTTIQLVEQDCNRPPRVVMALISILFFNSFKQMHTMKKFFYTVFISLAVVIIPSCTKTFNDLNTNENKPTS